MAMDYKKNAILAAVAIFGGGAITSFAGTWVDKIPMANTAFVGVTVGLGLAAFGALLIYDKFK